MEGRQFLFNTSININIMKRLILILGIALIGVMAFGQSASITGSIRVPNGADTTVYIAFQTEYAWGITFDYSAFDDVDAILDLGATMDADSNKFDRLNSAELPYTLADSSLSFEKDNFPFGTLAIKLTKTSVTAGLLMYYWIWR